VRFERWDGRTAGEWAREVDGAAGVVNLSGESIATGRWTRKKKDRIRASRLEAGAAIVEAVRAARVKPEVLIQASGVGIYGDPGERVLDETSPLQGFGFLGPFAREWEASTSEVEALGVRRAIIRTGIVLGMEDGVLPRFLTPFRFFLGGPLGRGTQGFSWIHISDEISAIRFLLENDGCTGPFNLTAPAPMAMGAFLKILGKAMGRPSWLPVPALTLKILFGQKAKEIMLSGQIVKPSRLIEVGYRFEFPDAESALRDLLGS
jgi:uncharacterized protein (TIGR01777 family)